MNNIKRFFKKLTTRKVDTLYKHLFGTDAVFINSEILNSGGKMVMVHKDENGNKNVLNEYEKKDGFVTDLMYRVKDLESTNSLLLEAVAKLSMKSMQADLLKEMDEMNSNSKASKSSIKKSKAKSKK